MVDVRVSSGGRARHRLPATGRSAEEKHVTEQVVEKITKVGIVGAGTMGSGIAEIVASKGIPVTFVEIDEDAVERANERIRASLDRQVNRSRIDLGERDAILGRIHGDVDYGALADCDLVLEAVPEKLDLKQEVFEQIDAVIRPDAIIATNTSSLPVMDLAVHSQRSNRVVGFHFFNPAQVMKLIELVRTVVTDEAVVETARGFAADIGKTPVIAGDRAGFIANHLLFPYLNQAVGMVEDGYATKEDVDNAMRFGAGLPMGPISTVDLVGIDTMIGIMDAIHAQFQDVRFAPRPVLSRLSGATWRGRKTAAGFYRYEEPGSSRILEDGAARPAADPDLVKDWTTVGVLGTGTMASGIVEVCAKAGFDVIVRGRSSEKAEAVAAKVSKSLQRMVDKGRLSEEDMVATLQRIKPTADIADLAPCDVVIEAVAEDIEIKRGLFAELAPHLKPDAVLSTTTSSLPVVECAMATDRPDRVLGLHFFNPAAVMKLVEIVPTVRTDDEVVEQSRAFVDRIGKVGVLCGDQAGFIVNALLFPYLNDAVKMLESHYATAEEIDTAMRLGCGFPMGPFQLMDVVGLDISLAIIEALQEEFRQPSYEPAPLLRGLVETGFLGRKAGRGFYVYT
jgi:3-hydroxybutyryl-CoA dehydrogenase